MSYFQSYAISFQQEISTLFDDENEKLGNFRLIVAL